MSLELAYNKPTQHCVADNRITNNASLKVRAGSREIMTYEEKLEFWKKSSVANLLGISDSESPK